MLIRVGLVVAVLSAAGCKRTPRPPNQCLYANVAYSVGATVCAPAQATEPMHGVLECVDNREDARWVQTGRPCHPFAATTDSAASRLPTGSVVEDAGCTACDPDAGDSAHRAP